MAKLSLKFNFLLEKPWHTLMVGFYAKKYAGDEVGEKKKGVYGDLGCSTVS